MTDFVVAIGLVLVIEGLLYAVFTDQLKAMMTEVLGMPTSTIRLVGVAVAAVGVLIVWFVRG
ncbi:MAG: DUF2065 domain-containing protein [Pseudomonadota bacterium]